MNKKRRGPGHLTFNKLTSIIILLLQKTFEQDEDFTFSEDEASTKINIGASYTFDPRTNKRPALLVKRGAVTNNKLVMDDTHFIDPINSRKGVVVDRNLSWTVFAMSKEPAQSDNIAQTAHDALTAFAPNIRTDYELDYFLVQQVGEVGQVVQGENTEYYAVPITIIGRFNQSVTVTQQALKIREIVIEQSNKL